MTGKPVLLAISAVWCHWCHVMDETTYSDPRVLAAIADGFVAVRIDNDRRPDLNRRYNMGGWPTDRLSHAGRRGADRGHLPAARRSSHGARTGARLCAGACRRLLERPTRRGGAGRRGASAQPRTAGEAAAGGGAEAVARRRTRARLRLRRRIGRPPDVDLGAAAAAVCRAPSPPSTTRSTAASATSPSSPSPTPSACCSRPACAPATSVCWPWPCTRSTPWPPASCATPSSRASFATPRGATGRRRTSRSCSTTTRASLSSTSTPSPAPVAPPTPRSRRRRRLPRRPCWRSRRAGVLRQPGRRRALLRPATPPAAVPRWPRRRSTAPCSSTRTRSSARALLRAAALLDRPDLLDAGAGGGRRPLGARPRSSRHGPLPGRTGRRPAGDQAQMTAALLDAYEASGDRAYLARARLLADWALERLQRARRQVPRPAPGRAGEAPAGARDAPLPVLDGRRRDGRRPHPPGRLQRRARLPRRGGRGRSPPTRRGGRGRPDAPRPGPSPSCVSPSTPPTSSSSAGAATRRPARCCAPACASPNRCARCSSSTPTPTPRRSHARATPSVQTRRGGLRLPGRRLPGADLRPGAPGRASSRGPAAD